MADARYKVFPATTRPTFDQARRPVDVYDIAFEVIDTGDTGMISIPVAAFTAERVHAAIQPLANQLAAMHLLGGGQ
jgi:hypothetical protein